MGEVVTQIHMENVVDRRLTLENSLPPAQVRRHDRNSFMGHVFTEIELSNPKQPELATLKVQALADTGALMLCIPEHIALQLNLDTESLREVSVADGRNMPVPYVGPLKVSFAQRFCYGGALVLGDEVLLGAVPMEDMDLVIHPARRELSVNPNSPNMPHARVK